METSKKLFDAIIDKISTFWYYFKIELFTLGGSSISLSTLLYVLFSVFLLIYLSGRLKKMITRKIISKYSTNAGTVQSIATIIRYAVLTLGLIIIIQSAGLDLSALSIVMGALGVGIGFGLQNITNNFLSGLIILFEQPIKVGDRITVGDIEGDVIKISARATSVLTNDNISLIIPNAEFVSSIVTNWSHNDRMVALRIPVGVSYKEDPEHIRKVILQTVADEAGIHQQPEPECLFSAYGENSINFIVRVWTTEYCNRPNKLKSLFYYELFKRFKNEGIEIPFPQRDLHIKSSDITF